MDLPFLRRRAPRPPRLRSAERGRLLPGPPECAPPMLRWRNPSAAEGWFDAPARRKDRCEPADRPGSGCARTDLRPRMWSSRDSRALDTPAATERCTAFPPCARARHTGWRGRGDRRSPPSPRARRGPIPVRGRSVPSSPCGGPFGRRALRLRLLAYRTVDRGTSDNRSTSDAVLPAGRRRNGSDRAGDRSDGHGVRGRRRQRHVQGRGRRHRCRWRGGRGRGARRGP
jgi:hypothetical protein